MKKSKDTQRLDWLSKRDTMRYGDGRWICFGPDASYFTTLRAEIDAAMKSGAK